MFYIRSELTKYLIVGGAGFSVDYSILYLLSTVFDVYYLTAASLSFVVAGVFVYYFSIHWVFSVRILENSRSEFIVFFMVGVVGLVLNWLIMWGFTEIFSVHYLASKFFSAALIFGFNFFVRKLVLFSAPVGT